MCYLKRPGLIKEGADESDFTYGTLKTQTEGMENKGGKKRCRQSQLENAKQHKTKKNDQSEVQAERHENVRD